METTHHLARTHQGRLYFDDRPGFDAAVRALREAQVVEVVLRALRRQRTLEQNRYYFGVVLALIAAHYGIDFDTKAEREALHDAVAFKFLRITNCPATGSPRRLQTSDPGFSTADFHRYVERVRRWAAEDGIVIPDPQRVPDEMLMPWRGEVAG